jgi:acetolactate synthase-1/2/3 large subunit
MTGNRFIAETLAGYGVTHVFFMPAGTYEVLAEMEGLNIKRVLVHSEKAAVYMADGYARASGRPGICMSQAAPGANNLAAGLGDPYCGVSPVIAITSARPPEERNRHAYQELDQMQFFVPVTKFNVTVDRVERIPDLLRQAFREATSGSPRPVHLDLQIAAANEEAELELIVEEHFTRAPAFRPEPEQNGVMQAAQLLKAAERPVIVAGGGVITSGAWDEVVELAEKLSIPVATSMNGKGTIPGNHPLSVGVCGLYSRSCANQIVCSADLVFFIGSLAGGQVTKNWTVPPQGTKVMQLDIEPTELGRNYPNCVSLLGDAKASLRRLIEALGPASGKKKWANMVREAVEKWRNEARPFRESDAVPIRPERLCRAIEEFLPDDALLVSDTGHSGIWTGTMIDLKHSGRNYLRAAGSLGWALPAAIGARCASPNRPVICFTGDGGFWYHLSELETAARYGINTVTVVNNNSSLSQETGEINRAYRNDLPANAYDLMKFNSINLAKLAEAMGCFGIRVEEPSELRPALDRALASGRPALVDVATDMRALPA